MSTSNNTTINLDEVNRKVSKAKALLILDHPFFGTAVSRRPIQYVCDRSDNA